jgi:hypothetical protein
MPPTTTQKTINPKSSMAAVKCGCGIVLGWTDGVVFVVGVVSFSKLVTGTCAGCGSRKTWRPCKPDRAV